MFAFLISCDLAYSMLGNCIGHKPAILYTEFSQTTTCKISPISTENYYSRHTIATLFQSYITATHPAYIFELPAL